MESRYAPMPRRLLAYLVAAMLVIWAALAALSPAFSAEPVFPPGSRIGLEPPGGLKPSTHFPGFEDIDRKVAVTILELPASAYAELARAANATEQRGLTDVKGKNFRCAAAPGCWSPAAPRSMTSRCTNGFCWRARPPTRILPC